MEKKIVDSLLLPLSPQTSQDGLETKYKLVDTPSDTSSVHHWIQKHQVSDVDDEGLGQTSSESHSQTNSLFDSEDDLSLGADAIASWDSNYTTDESCDGLGSVDPSSPLSSPCTPDDTRKRKLGWVNLGNSFDSCSTDLSNSSSRDVTELLFQREADPEEILINLGFGSLDLSMRIPDRFLSVESGAKGIDFERFHERDMSGYSELTSSSCTSPVCSDQGTCRIPTRFLIAPKRVPDMAQDNSGNVIPIICEPEEIPEDSFDLMRHLRLNRNQRKNNTGGFLEPLTEELEASSVGSGSVRTKISRKPSEETLCAGLAGFAQDSSQDIANMAADLCCNVISSALSELREELKRALNGSDVGSYGVFFNLEGDSENQEAAGGCDVRNHYVSDWLHCNDESACEDTAQIIPCSSGQSSTSAESHLSILGTIVQDSFELEEIVTDEGDCCHDESSWTTGILESNRMKMLKRDNSGDSSGFGEELVCEKRVGSSQGLLGAEPNETSSETTPKHEGKSPRSTFALRRTRSLTKQRPIDNEDEIPQETPCSRNSSTDTFATCVEGLESTPQGPDETGGDSNPPQDDYSNNLELLSNDFVFGLSESFPSAVRGSNEVSSELEKGMEGLLAIGLSRSAAEDYPVYEKDETAVYNGRCELLTAGGPHTRCTYEPANLKRDKTLGLRESHREEPKLFKISRSLSLREALEGLKELCGCMKRSNSEKKWSVTKQRAGTAAEVGSSITPVHSLGLDIGDGDLLRAVELNTMDISEHGCTVSEAIVNEDNSELHTSVELDMSDVAAGNGTTRVSDSKVKRAVAVSQHYAQEMDVMKQRMEEYRAGLKALQSVSDAKELYFTKEMITRLGNDVSNVQRMRSMILRELDVTQKLLTESMNLPQHRSPEELHFSGLAEKMNDLLQEQTSLRTDMSTLLNEMSAREKLRTRAWCEIEMAKLRIEMEKLKESCVQEIRQEIRASVPREVHEYFHRIDRLHQELEAKDAVIKDLTERLQRYEDS